MTHVVQWIDVPCAHELRQVHMRQVNLVCITQGYKDVWHKDEWQRQKPGELLLFAAQSQWRLRNHPGPSGSYMAQVLAVPTEWLQEFHLRHPEKSSQRGLALDKLSLSGWVKEAWQRVTDPSLQEASQALTRHRVIELLLVLAESGHTFESAESVLLQNHIHALIQQNPRQSWNRTSLAKHFHMSSSTLLRRLQDEGTTASRCVREARLESALNLLQTTQQPVGVIAEACGYASHSRFSTAFEQHFGVLPLKLRQQKLPQQMKMSKKNR